MVNLEANSPCGTLLPLTVGTVVLTETILPEGKVWSISPCPVGHGTMTSTKTSKTLWIGRDHGLKIGGKVPAKGAVTDQSDAWACVTVNGADAGEVLARLCPVDLSKMREGDVSRTLINHLTAIICTTPEGFEIYVFRAFARTLIHELEEVANSVLGRKHLAL